VQKMIRYGVSIDSILLDYFTQLDHPLSVIVLV
jgi:hypothetical protein